VSLFARDRIRKRTGEPALEYVVLVCLCFAAFAGAAWTSQSVFERLPHTEDESAFLFQAQTVASAQLVADAPEIPAFFSMPFIIVREGMWFGKYPPGYPIALAPGVLIGQPWIVNATFAALCVLVIYLLGRRYYGENTALIAGFLLIVSPFFLLQAGSLLSHIVSLFWTLLFIALFVRARSQLGFALPIAGGIALGMLLLTRPLTSVGVALPFAIWSVASIVRQRRIHRSYLIMAATTIPFVLAYLAYNNLTTGSPFQTAYELWWPFDRIGFGPDIGVNGHDFEDGIRNTRANLDALGQFLFGWPGRLSLVPAIALSIASLTTLLSRSWHRPDCAQNDRLSPEGFDLLLASVAISIVAIHILYWTPGQMYGPRYYMEAVGPLVLLSARCFDRLGASIAIGIASIRPRIRAPQAWSYGLVVAVLALLTVYAHISWAPQQFDRFRGWNNITGEDVAIVKSYQLDNALVFVERRAWTDYAPFFAENRPSLDTNVVYASDRGLLENRQLMDLYPDRQFYRYSAGRVTEIPH
jgi:4-amino-4-deoxy-L-arabinose transferase-like glycosyltransferase